jgi:hypothetical protein
VSAVPSRALPLLAVALVATAATACGAEALPEELFAVPVERVVPSGAVDEDAVPAFDEAGDVDDVDTAAALAADDEDDDAAEVEAAVDEVDDVDPPAPDPAPEPPTQAEQEPPAEIGPADAAIARFVATTSRGALSSDHLVTDVLADGVREVLVGLVQLDGRLELVLGRWDGEVVAEAGRVDHQGAQDLGTMVVRDLDGDGRAEVLLPFRDHPRVGALVATAVASGELTVPGGCPVTDPVRQALDFGDGSRVVQLACASRDVRGNEGLVWSDGVFLGAAAVGGSSRGGRSD